MLGYTLNIYSWLKYTPPYPRYKEGIRGVYKKHTPYLR